MERKRLEDEQPEAGIFVDHASVVQDAGDVARKSRDLLKRYGLALALAGLALLIRGVLPMQEGTAFYELSIAAVVISGWFGGRGPGLLALLICAAGILYWFIPPADWFSVPPDHLLGLGLFISLGLLLTEFSRGRRRTEHALRESEERFRALVQFSFDVYWETDSRHRFTRQEFSERLTDAPASGSEIGKTRWEIPYVEPDEEAWRKHRATLDAHLPFRDFELARPTAGGGTRYVSVSGLPALDQSGRFVGYRGVGRHITERKRAEAEHRVHVWFLESLDRINRTLQAASDLEQMMSDVLEAVLEVFSCDRAWLVYPCDPHAASWRVVMERARPQFGTLGPRAELPTDAGYAAGFAAARAAPGVVLEVPAMVAERFAVRSRMAMAVYPKGDAPYLFGVHQCSHTRAWTADEQRLFEEIGRRLTDALTNLIAARNLRESERRLEAAQRLAHVGWWERDYETGHVSLSDEACRILGVQPVELPHWHGRWLSLIHPDDRQKAADASERALRGEARYDVEYRVVRPDGAVRVVHSQGDVTRDESGRALRQFGVMQDVTELRKTQHRLEAAQHLARVGWWECDRVADRITFSDEVAEIFGIAQRDRSLDHAEWMKLLPTIIHPDDWGRVSETSAALRGGPRYDLEFRVVHGNGTVRVVTSQVDVTRDESGRPVRDFGVAQDITALRQAEQGLRASEEQYRSIFNAAQDAMVLRDADFRVVDVNHAWVAVTGVSREEALGRDRVLGKDPPEFEALLKAQHLRVLAGESIVLETERTRRDGRRIDLELRCVPVHYQGRPHVLYIGRDITERKRAEESLRESEAYLTEAQRLSHTGSWALDAASNRYLYTSEEFDRLFGFDPDGEKPTREAVLERMHPEDRISWIRILEKSVREKLDTTSQYRIVLPDGSIRHIHTIRHPVVNSAGEVVKLVGTSIDITERKRAEEERERLRRLEAELAHANRVNTLGELTASIVHEVSQPLGAMITSAAAGARWLAAEPPDITEGRAALDNIAADGKRAREVIARIRALTKRQLPRKERLDINRELLDVLALTERELRSHDIVLRTQLGEALRRVAGDRVQLQQVLLNMILNAIEAMSGVHDGPRQLTIVSREDAPNAVVVEVRDSGMGLDPEGAERVFEAFYTTKAEGMGIGLSISRSIIEAHGGRLWASPNEPRGAVFGFSLPVAGEEQS